MLWQRVRQRRRRAGSWRLNASRTLSTPLCCGSVKRACGRQTPAAQLLCPAGSGGVDMIKRAVLCPHPSGTGFSEGLVRRLAGRNASRSWESPQGAASVDAALRHAVRSNPSTQQAWRDAADGGGGQNPMPNPALSAAAYYPQPNYPQSWVPGVPPGAAGFPGGVAGFGSLAMPPGAGSGGSRCASRSSSGGPYAGGPPSRASSGGLPNDVGRNGSGFSAGRSGSGFSGGHLPRGAGACPPSAPACTANASLLACP